MPSLRLSGTDLTVSSLCLGAAMFGEQLPERDVFALLDRFVELGGNFVDTARLYSDWLPGERHRSERILSDWVKARPTEAARVCIATKGMHPDLATPTVPRSSEAEIRHDLESSLRTLRLESVPLYWLHRDDPTKPAAFFVDLLNALHREGKVHAFGASNWTAARLREAHEHAQRTGQKGFAANQPLWAMGCLQARPPKIHGLVLFDDAAHAFHRETGMAVIPYTSQAGGFFSKWARPFWSRPRKFSAHDWHTPANLVLAKVAQRLAEARGVPISAIVLAWLRAQPFPVVPIVGGHTAAQLEDSVAALGVQLTAEEMRVLAEAGA